MREEVRTDVEHGVQVVVLRIPNTRLLEETKDTRVRESCFINLHVSLVQLHSPLF